VRSDNGVRQQRVLGQGEVIRLPVLLGHFLSMCEVEPLGAIRPNSVAGWIYDFIAIEAPPPPHQQQQQFRCIAPCFKRQGRASGVHRLSLFFFSVTFSIICVEVMCL